MFRNLKSISLRSLDHVRMKMFAKAIRRMVCRSHSILITGDPFCILARLCAKEGANRIFVYETDNFKIAKYYNNDQIKVIRGDGRNHADFVNVAIFYQDFIFDSYLKVAKILNAKGVINNYTWIMPNRIVVTCEPVLYNDEIEGVSLDSPVQASNILIQPYGLPVQVADFRPGERDMHSFDFSCIANNNGWINGIRITTVSFPSDGLIDGETNSSWYPIYLPIDPVEVEKNQTLKFRIDVHHKPRAVLI